MCGLVALLTVTSVSACTGGTSPVVAPSTMTIGLLVPTSGPGVERGRAARQGADLAIDVVNYSYPDLPLPLAATSGLRTGAKLALAVGDTQGAAERVEDQANVL